MIKQECVRIKKYVKMTFVLSLILYMVRWEQMIGLCYTMIKP